MLQDPESSASATVYEQARAAADVILQAATIQPQVGIVLGSGLGALVDAIEGGVSLSYSSIPYLLPTTVPGHDGRVVIGTLSSVPVVALRGRLHLYEGYSPQQVTFPLRVLGLLGIKTCILTNAAGGLNPAYASGSLMLIRDHIGLPSLAGLNPLFGQNDDRFGPRFPAMTDTYDPLLRLVAREAASQRGMDLAEGIYAMVGGPSYETQAELRMLRALGVDAVGMSTVPEAIVARQMGIRVLGFSIVTNLALVESGTPEVPDHERVLRMAGESTQRLTALLRDVIGALI